MVESRDPVLRGRGIQEIVDLNVLPPYRGKGIGSAQRIYVKRGYVPDGAGALRGTEAIAEGAAVVLDEDVTLRMLKPLDQRR